MALSLVSRLVKGRQRQGLFQWYSPLYTSCDCRLMIAQAGFPFFQLDRFLKILVQDLNKYVAISEEYANDAVGKAKSGGLLFDRKVTRVITPGTLVDETFMDPYANNFLLALFIRPQDHGTCKSTSTAQDPVLGDHTLETKLDRNIGLAWLDLSTGEFYTQNTNLGALPASMVRIGAKEVILNRSMDEDLQPDIMDILKHDRYLVAWQHGTPTKSTVADWSPMLETPVIESEQDSYTSEEVVAGGMILDYVADKLQGLGIKLQPPVRKLENESMGIDRHSMRGLEILETSRDGLSAGKGSLLHSMRRTVTKSGARLLRERICMYSTTLRHSAGLHKILFYCVPFYVLGHLGVLTCSSITVNISYGYQPTARSRGATASWCRSQRRHCEYTLSDI